ncbi:MAG TPA: CotH kinase family protein, partial [Verrucomicrobiae bacterium]|nr:CotH kinase family protein [Verrucomicrobiae bacterium]
YGSYDGNWAVLELPCTIPSNEWHFVTATGGQGQLSIYVDGILIGSSTSDATQFGAAETDFKIGGGIFDDSGDYFPGQIDEVAVWDRMLSSNEISGFVSSGQVDFSPFIQTDLHAEMYNSNSSAYVRIPFVLSDTPFSGLTLQVRYDDGFIAYLNGHEIARANAPDVPAWNSSATRRHADIQAVEWETFDVTAARAYLQPGSNVLAIHALNTSSSNTDFLIQAQLLAGAIEDMGASWRYFTVPTPGGLNAISAADQGPIIFSAGHFPLAPLSSDSLIVTSRIAQGFNSISNVTLRYRVMFGPETPVSMNDSGTNGDAIAGDGIWTGTIPAGVAAPGQMIRYLVGAFDAAGQYSRWPIFANAFESERYLGTVTANPSVQTSLPDLALYIQTPSSADTATGTRASLFYGGELYDNITVSVHGQSSIGWPKKSHNIEFTKDHQFLSQANGVRQSHIILMSNYGDKSRLRTSLTYAVTALAGGVAFNSFPVRIDLNGAFWGVEDMVEHGDETFLERIGRDPNGALYKMYNNLSTASGNEKKTREWEGTADLTAFITNLDGSLPLSRRVAYAYDSFDLPQAANFFATMALVSDQDFGDKNYYLYHDNDGTGEWSVFPWDVDLTWGRNWVLVYGDPNNYLNDVLFQTNVLNFNPGYPIQFDRYNRLFDVFFNSADFRQMYLRRLRTLMDTLLMAPGTPTNQLVIEPLIRQYENALNPPGSYQSDAMLDLFAWGPYWGNYSYSQFPSDAERLISVHLPGRRDFLFNSPSARLNGDPIPGAQSATAAVSIASWDYSPASGNQNEQYVELGNTNAFAVDVSNWQLSGGIGMTLRPGTVIPAGRSLYLSPNARTFRSRTNGPAGGQNLYVQAPYSGFLSTLGNSPLLLRNSTGWLVASNSFAGPGSGAPFNPGNLAVLRLGTGAQALASHGNSVFIDEFTPNGTLAGSRTIPDNGTNALIISGSANSEGALTRSADGRTLIVAGYQISMTNSTSSLSQSSSAAVPRAIGVMDTCGGFAIAGIVTNQYSGNNFRSATTDGAGNYWGAGATSGTFYFGTGSPGTIQNTVANSLVIQDIAGNLYLTTIKSSPGIWKVLGAPTTGPVTPTLYVSTGAGSSGYAFAFNTNFIVAYIA